PAPTQPISPILFQPHSTHDITILWTNIDARSNFLTFRKESRGPIERILQDFASVLQSGVIDEVVSVNASRNMFCVVVACRRDREDGVMEQIFSVT
ncbi:hypothetical protein FB567DRAFT_455249, partial [Paraphoma chrysanthemicola]